MDNDMTYQQMQDEMSRFEAEIAEEGPDMYGGSMLPGPLIPSDSRYVPPPPPPPSLMLPSQLQRTQMPSPPHYPQYQNTFITSMSPPRPQPAVLSSAPQLYKKQDKKKDGYYGEVSTREIEPPVMIPMMTPVIPVAQVHDPPASHHTSSSSHSSSHKAPKKEKKNRKTIRTAGGTVWEDSSLLDWPDDDFRLFCGDLGNDVTDELLTRTFGKYMSFSKAKVIRDKRTNKSKGFGFISFREPGDFIKAMKEMNGRYVGSRPIKLRKSTWRARSLDVVRKKEKEKAALISLLTGGPNK